MKIIFTDNIIIVLLGAISALVFALYSQYYGGFHPCEMCIWQRWVYVAVVVAAMAAIEFKQLRYLVALILLGQIGLAIFHTGVEQKWWEGFTTCSSGLKTDSIEDLKAQIMGAPVVRCDEVTWLFLGLSMATWNAIYASILFVISLLSCRKST